MIFITGETRAREFVEIVQNEGWGRMITSTRPLRPYPGEPFAIDNGAYSAYANNKPWSPDTFEKIIDRVKKEKSRPYMTVCPDIVAGGEKSLQLTRLWARKLDPELNLYLAVQDGMTPEAVEIELEAGPYAGLFVGGTVPFKIRTSKAWGKLAHGHRLKLHIGRVGTPRRIRWAHDIANADSIDSALPLWARDRLKNVIKALRMTGRTEQTEIMESIA